MKLSTLESLAAQIGSVERERAKLHSLIAERSLARQQIEAGITSAQAATDTAGRALADSLASEAMGEAQPGEVADARAAVASADKALATARKSEPQARELAGAEAGLMARASPLDVKIAGLRQQHDAARLEMLKVEFESKVAAYNSAASDAIAALAEAVGFDRYMTHDVGQPQGVIGQDVYNAYLPSLGVSRPPPDFNLMVQQARARVLADFDTAR